MTGVWNAIKYVIWIIGQIILGAVAIARDVVRKETKMTPIVIEYPLRVTKPWQIAGFTTSITMTPGTLSCGTIPPKNPGEPTILLVQAVYGSDPAQVIAGLADMEARMCPSIASIDHGAPGQGKGHRNTLISKRTPPLIVSVEPSPSNNTGTTGDAANTESLTPKNDPMADAHDTDSSNDSTDKPLTKKTTATPTGEDPQ